MIKQFFFCFIFFPTNKRTSLQWLWVFARVLAPSLRVCVRLLFVSDVIVCQLQELQDRKWEEK